MTLEEQVIFARKVFMVIGALASTALVLVITVLVRSWGEDIATSEMRTLPPRHHVNPVAPLATYADGDRVDGVAYCVNGEVWLTGSDGIFQPLLKGMAESVSCKEFRP